jgi:alcohol dehydrogenase class IV
MDRSLNCLQQEYKDTHIPLIALPTTAGTGSESTRFAVIYYDGKKQSVTHNSIVPNYAILDPLVLISLPLYQKKCTMLDALCQGIESWWSVNSSDESKGYSKKAIDLIMANWKAYIEKNTEKAAEKIILAANFAGRAINITQTTAAHAMSYKLTSMYKLPHGHAVAVCLPYVWEYMVDHLDECIDPRGSDYLSDVFNAISHEMGCSDSNEAIALFRDIMRELDMRNVALQNDSDIDVLTASVNAVRLINNPVKLNQTTLRAMYEVIVRR